MNKNGHDRKVPNLSLLLGYTFILIVIVFFAFVQFKSTQNLNVIEIELRKQLSNLSDLEDRDLSSAVSDYRKLSEISIVSNLHSTLTDVDSSDNYPFTTKSNLKKRLEYTGTLLDAYSQDLYRSQAILFITFLGLSLILSTLLTISEFDQMKKYEREKNKRVTDKQLMDVLEQERNLLAVELHDEVAQKLSIISQHFDAISEDHTDLLKRYNSDVIQKIRTMAQSLRSPELEDDDFQKQIEFLFYDFESISQIKLTASFIGLPALNISKEMKLHIYRIIQEMLSNCRKHSYASTVSLSLRYIHPAFRIHYKDNGVGMELDENYSGLGLKSIIYRLNILNASIERKSQDGLEIEIEVPVEL